MSEAPGLMRGKRGLIMGVANNRSIAWGIAKACHAHGADLAFTYQGDALKKRVGPLAEEVGGRVVGHCDVTEPATIDAAFAAVEAHWGALDFLVHAIAFSDKDELDGRYVDTTPDNFSKTMMVSCYSFTAVAQRAEKLMPQRRLAADADLLRRREMDAALQRHGGREGRARGLGALPRGRSRARRRSASTRSRPGRSRRLAASGIGDFRYILKWNEHNAPLRRSVTTEEVGDTAVYFLSDLSRARDR